MLPVVKLVALRTKNPQIKFQLKPQSKITTIIN